MYGEGGVIARCLPWHDRVPQGALARLERHAGKLARAVLRGLGGSDPAWLPGVDGAIYPSTVTNSGPLREPADTHSIYAIKTRPSVPSIAGHLHF